MRRAMLMSALVVPAMLLIAGVAYARTIDCNGGPGDDRMLGLDGADTLYGVGGMDALKGQGGADGIFGGEGHDLVRGGTHSVANDHARDLLICGPGRDKVFFVRGQDVLRGCEIKRPSN